jgi:hypothetical protein
MAANMLPPCSRAAAPSLSSVDAPTPRLGVVTARTNAGSGRSGKTSSLRLVRTGPLATFPEADQQEGDHHQQLANLHAHVEAEQRGQVYSAASPSGGGNYSGFRFTFPDQIAYDKLIPPDSGLPRMTPYSPS